MLTAEVEYYTSVRRLWGAAFRVLSALCTLLGALLEEAAALLRPWCARRRRKIDMEPVGAPVGLGMGGGGLFGGAGPARLRGGAGPLAGKFVLTLRVAEDEVDEWFVVAHVETTPFWIVYTTGERPPHDFEYRMLELRAGPLADGGFRLVRGIDAARQAPVGLRQGVNWMCSPPRLAVAWDATAEVDDLLVEGAAFAAAASAQGVDSLNLGRVPLRGGRGAAAGEAAGVVAAAAAPLAPLLPMAPQAAAAAQDPVAAAAAGVAAAAAMAAAVGQQPALGGPAAGAGRALGFGGQDGAPPPVGDALLQEVLQLRQEFDNLRFKDSPRSDSRKRKKKKNKDKKKRKRSRSTSSSGSSSSSLSGKFMAWSASSSKDSQFDVGQQTRQHTLRFKRRADLLKFHLERPGALAAHFLCQVSQKLGRPMPTSSAELLRTDVVGWSERHSGVKDVRDQREIQFLGRILQDLGTDRLPQLADLLALRIREIRAAKGEGGSWEKAGVMSLLPGPYAANAPLADGAFHL